MDFDYVFGSLDSLFPEGEWAEELASYPEDYLAARNVPDLVQVAYPNPIHMNDAAPADGVQEPNPHPIQNNEPAPLEEDNSHPAEAAALEDKQDDEAPALIPNEALALLGLCEIYIEPQAGEAAQTSNNASAEPSEAQALEAANNMEEGELDVSRDMMSNPNHEQRSEAQIDPSQPQAAETSINYKRRRGRPPKGSTPRLVTRHAPGGHPRPRRISARDFELPPGWRTERRVRQTGRTAGQKDTYYIYMSTQQICRSRPDVDKYMKLLQERRIEVEAAATLREMSQGMR